MTDFAVDSNRLLLKVGSVKFPSPISEVLSLTNSYVVLTKSHESPTTENVWAVNTKGEVLWQVKNPEKVNFEGIEYDGISDPYVKIYHVDDKTVRLINWGGYFVEVDVRTGKFTKNIIEFRKGKRPW